MVTLSDELALRQQFLWDIPIGSGPQHTRDGRVICLARKNFLRRRGEELLSGPLAGKAGERENKLQGQRECELLGWRWKCCETCTEETRDEAGSDETTGTFRGRNQEFWEVFGILALPQNGSKRPRAAGGGVRPQRLRLAGSATPAAGLWGAKA